MNCCKYQWCYQSFHTIQFVKLYFNLTNLDIYLLFFNMQRKCYFLNLQKISEIIYLLLKKDLTVYGHDRTVFLSNRRNSIQKMLFVCNYTNCHILTFCIVHPTEQDLFPTCGTVDEKQASLSGQKTSHLTDTLRNKAVFNKFTTRPNRSKKALFFGWWPLFGKTSLLPQKLNMVSF